MGFIYPALEQIISHISRMRKRTLGKITCPMLMRTPYGCGVYAPEHHSESTEGIFASIPGLRVIVPSTPTRAYEMILAAIKVNDPILTDFDPTPGDAIVPEPEIVIVSEPTVLVKESNILPFTIFVPS